MQQTAVAVQCLLSRQSFVELAKSMHRVKFFSLVDSLNHLTDETEWFCGFCSPVSWRTVVAGAYQVILSARPKKKSGSKYMRDKPWENLYFEVNALDGTW